MGFTLPARTITPAAWAKASHTTPALQEEVDSSVNGIMAELEQPYTPNNLRVVGCAPWIRQADHCSGVLWGSTPYIKSHWRHGEGWILSYSSDPLSPATCYLRISPAPEGVNVVQYGFCPIRLNKMEELKEAEWGRDQLHMSSMVIQTGRESSFRTDKMVTSAVRLFNPVSRTPQSDKFMELLGRRSMSVFIEDMLRGCYADSSTGRDILRGRDNRYREMMGLIADHAYQPWANPVTEQDLGRFRNAMGVTSSDRWYPDAAWPYLYNVVMPRSIFEANSRGLELGIPPIIPHYVTPREWMFNGRWGSPCTGLVFTRTCGISKSGQKIVAGLLGKSNLDLPGAVSIWPVADNPPQEWVDQFVSCIERVSTLEMPLDIADRADLVLHESRRIPVAFRTHVEGSAVRMRTYKFARLVEGIFDHSTLQVTGLTARECDPGGGEWIGEEVHVGANPNGSVTVTSTGDGTTVEEEEDDPDDNEGYMDCTECGNERHEDDMTMCAGCDEPFCDGCIQSCPECNDNSCQDCRYTINDAGRDQCGNCGRERIDGE